MASQGIVTKEQRPSTGYFASIRRAAWSILEGMAVTFSYFRRPPVTVQYPDRIPEPMSALLPERFRGLLEVDVLCCTGCEACERACPIDVIRIRVGKEDKLRLLERFDIDLSKCMYCGLCVEACPVDAQAPGDSETTHAIRFTREFEGCSDDIAKLTYRYIVPGDRVLVAKNRKGQIHTTPARGERLREARQLAARCNRAAIERTRERRGSSDAPARRRPDAQAVLSVPGQPKE